MSWPTDGRPRFVTSAIGGSRILADGRAENAGGEYYVLDRANCHREVARWTAGRRPLPEPHVARRRAAALCAELNAA